MKLIVLCALIWVQTLQVDHVTDQTLDSQHTDCLVCKSIGDSALGGTGIALVVDHEYAKVMIDAYISLHVQRVRYNVHPARAPPISS